MLKVYAFEVKLRRLGVLVAEGKDPVEALREAWKELETDLGKPDWAACSTLVEEFPGTDEGWDEAAELAQELTEYE